MAGFLTGKTHYGFLLETKTESKLAIAPTNDEPYFTNVWTEFTGTTPAEVAAGQTLLLTLA